MRVRALLTDTEDEVKTSRVTFVDADDLGEGDVLVRVEWSTVNFKDGNALTRPGGVMKTQPLIGGIDFAGVVVDSGDVRFAAGDRVVSNGQALSMTHHGGYAEYARVPGDWLIPVPEVFTTRHAMAIGTAGYTAMLALLALEQHGVTPSSGPVLVTGAAGGVGSIAVSLLSSLGYTVTASSGRPHLAGYLRDLGAAEIIDRAPLAEPGAAVQDPRWAAAIDSVGSHTLANVLAQMRYGGVVSACGLAQGNDLPASVSPFLARGLVLVGIDSVLAPRGLRLEAWRRLGEVLDVRKLEATITEVALADVPATAASILRGDVRGRTVVDVTA